MAAKKPTAGQGAGLIAFGAASLFLGVDGAFFAASSGSSTKGSIAAILVVTGIVTIGVGVIVLLVVLIRGMINLKVD